EHVPLQFADAQNANFRMAVAGSPADSVIVELLNGSTVAATSDPIHGGEVVWMSGELAAGANSLRIVAAQGNTSPVAYTIDASVVGDVPFTWAGTSYGAPTHASDGGSSVRLNFPTDGVYQFKLATQAGGRFQFVLGDNLLRRTVDAAAEAQFTAFIPAGLHTLSMIQAPGAATTAWSVEIAPGEATSDSLPFQRTSSTFGGPGDTFREEWIPLQYSGAQPVNIRISVTGAATDSVSLELYNQKTLAYTAAKVYGGEVLWNAAALTSGTNFLHITAGAANSGPVTYQVEVVDIPAAPLSWSGVAYAASQNSTASFYAPVTGVYTFSLSISEGAGLITIDDATATQGRASLAAGSKSELRVPLSVGLHTVTFQQSADQRTVWTIDVKQRATGPWIVSLPLVIASTPAQ
ncbi:MAG TPA: hypothetical protein VFT99_15425, partial [Roseiflexaceae bacterium]|nr:hypothetical protein [Roseiflexaceae bacterium]